MIDREALYYFFVPENGDPRSTAPKLLSIIREETGRKFFEHEIHSLNQDEMESILEFDTRYKILSYGIVDGRMLVSFADGNRVNFYKITPLDIRIIKGGRTDHK